MSNVYIVNRAQGAGWAAGIELTKQDGWKDHAEMMDQMHDDGFVVYAGPLVTGGDFESLIIVRADSEQDVRDAFAEDPWVLSDISKIVRVVQWDVRLGEIPDEEPD